MELPFKSRAFDSAVSFQVMEHLPEPLEFLKENFRVLKPGGYLLITTPFMWGEHEAPYDFYRYTRYGLKYLAEKAGYEVVSIIPDTKFWATHVLRLNYYLLRFARGPLKPLLMLLLYPVFYIGQWAAWLLDRIPHNYTIETSTFTTMLRKPEMTAEGKD
ncbi:MAG: class I SAM-dependent methyltransferase [Syntrophothermus sp.]